MDLTVFLSRTRQLLAPILPDSGTVLYSSCGTLRRGDYYFLGLNPGGEVGETDTIGRSLDTLLEKKENAYNQNWSGRRRYEPGAHPLQLRAHLLFNELRTPLEDVCASNLIFSRSRDERHSDYPKRAELCWPVHKLILDIVQPRVIITFGKKPFDFIRGKLGAETRPGIPTGHRRWQWCHVADVASVRRMIGLPHLSRFRPSDELLAQIRDRVSAARPSDD